MAQVALNANASSALFNTLAKSKVDDLYSYEAPLNQANAVNCNIINVLPRSLPSPANIPGSEISFKLPRSGLLQNACFLVTATLTTGSIATTELPGLRLFDTVALRSQSKTIHQYNDAYQHSRFKTDEIEKSAAILPLVGGNFNLAAGTSVTYVIPLYSSFLDSTSTYLDLSFIEEMSVDVKFNTPSKMGTAAGVFTAFDIKLFLRYVNMDASTKKAYWGNNFKQPQLNMVITDTYAETDVPIPDDKTSVEVPLRCPYNVKRTFFYVSNSAADVGPSAVAMVRDVSFRMSGQLAFDNIPTPIFKYLALKDNPSYLANAATTGASVTLSAESNVVGSRNVWVINHGESDSTLYNSGSISFGNLNSPTLNLNVVTTGGVPLGTAGFVVKTVHEILKLCTIDSASGFIEASYST